MLLLHAYPHRHEYSSKLAIEVGTKKAVKVDFEINEHSNIGFDVEIQLWSNLNDGVWKSYPLPYIVNNFGIFEKINNSLDFDDLTTEINETHYKNEGYSKGKPIIYSAYGYVPGETVGTFECTFRGRYKCKFTDNWTDWFWIGERDKFKYGQNATIKVVPLTSEFNKICLKCGGIYESSGICVCCKKPIISGISESFHYFYSTWINLDKRDIDNFSEISDISRISTPSPDPPDLLDFAECELTETDYELSDFTDTDSDYQTHFSDVEIDI